VLFANIDVLEMANSKGSLNRLWDWIKDQIVQDVPEYLAACEFDCNCVHECRMNRSTLREWKSCETPLHGAVQYIGITIPEVEERKLRLDTDAAHGVS
jgi:hypothetical protein